MDIFLRVLQGAYAYLLIFQIIIVSLLMLVLLWLIVRRTREAAANSRVEQNANTSIEAAVPASVGSPDVATEAAAPNPAIPAAGESVDELKKNLSDSQAELGKAGQGGEEVKSLQEKIKYLESKLLEYEILQEEIGTLSALKLENEELKKKITLGGGAPAETSPPPSEPVLTEPTLSDPTPVPQQVFDAPAEPPAPAEAAPAPEIAAEPPPAPEPIAEVAAAEAAPAAAPTKDEGPAELQSLLAQIDELTKDQPPPDKTA